jgi:hypothetical protein
MIKNILMYLFERDVSRVSMLIIVITTILVINKKYTEGFLLFVLGGLIVGIIEALLDI